MDVRDIFGEQPRRPNHPDFWALSSIILKLKGALEAVESMDQKGEIWKAEYEAIGDFDSIAYCAIQAAMSIHDIETGADWERMKLNPFRYQSYISSVQAYFDGFAMGAEFMRGRK